MTEEEWTKYGLPVVPKYRDLRRGEVAFAVDNATSLAHAARMVRASEARMRKEMARHCIAVPDEWKEDTDMPAIKLSEAQAREILPPAVLEKAFLEDQVPARAERDSQDPAGSPQGDKLKTRLQTLMDKLTKEQYLQLKAEGLSDIKILNHVGVGQWVDVLSIAKKKWGVEGMSIRPPKPKGTNRAAGPEKTAPAAGPQPGVTVADALRMRGEIADDIECLENILKVSERAELTGRVIAMLAWYRDSYRQGLARIDEVLGSTVVQL